MDHLQEGGEIYAVLFALFKITEINDNGGVSEKFRGLSELVLQLGGDLVKVWRENLQNRKGDGTRFQLHGA